MDEFRPKKHYALYYFNDSAAAKARAAELRTQRQSAIVIDGYVFKGERESCDIVEFVGKDPEWEAKILAVYEGTAVATKAAAPEDTQKIFIPENWQKLSWTKLQALASEIKPDETIRNKDEARQIIADYLEDNPQE